MSPSDPTSSEPSSASALKEQISSPGVEAASSPSQDPVPPEEGDELYDYEGFDPKQQRLLWTITAVIVLAIFANSYVNRNFDQAQRAKEYKIADMADEYARLHDVRVQQERAAAQVLVRAILNHDEQTQSAILTDLGEAFRQEQKELADLRHEKGLEGPVVDEQTIKDYQDKYFREGYQYAARSQAATRPSTLPTTRAAGTGSASRPQQ